MNTVIVTSPLPLAAAPGVLPRRKPRRVLPGFGLALGYTLVYLSLLVLIPLSAVFLKTATLGWEPFWNTVTAPHHEVAKIFSGDEFLFTEILVNE